MNAGVFPQSGHALHVTAEHHHEARAGARHHSADGEPVPVGRFSSRGSWLSERWVFAMQTGISPNPSCSILAMSFSACAW